MKTTAFLLLAALVLVACGGETRKSDAPREVETAIDLDALSFDSRDPGCKTPFGAVPAGTTVSLRFKAKAGDLAAVRLVVEHKLVIGNNDRREFKPYKTVDLKRVPGTDGKDSWEGSFTYPDAGLYGYSFELVKTPADRVWYANNWDEVKIPYVQVKGLGGKGKVTSTKKWFKIPYQQTVYRKDFTLPAWSRDMVVYYIFPERFKNGNKANDPKVGQRFFYGKKPIEVHADWNDELPWVPGAGRDNHAGDDNEYCNDFYGGDLEGVIQKLDHIKSLGVNVIYLNPVFRAPSNHKYDTSDYMTIDEAFGDLATFRRLVAEAKARGIRIVLDTSLNHCGSDSTYMDRYGKYPGTGAFENEKIRADSPFRDWFIFKPGQTNPDRMYDQWANPSLATLKETDSWKAFAYRNADSVTKFWLKLGIGGWRMDVTPWKSDEFWREWYKEVKATNPDAITFAEVWFDASKYLLGDMYDSTMNYIFRAAALNLGNGHDARTVRAALEMMHENYPPEVQHRLMNLISSHDLPRGLFEFGYRKRGDSNYQDAVYRFRLALALQFTYPGAPTIYYGDEVGMTGGEDPFNRGPFPWPEDGGKYWDKGLMEHIQWLAELRRNNPALAGGGLEFLPGDRNVLAYLRTAGDEFTLVALNNGKAKAKLALPPGIAAALHKTLPSQVGADGILEIDPLGFKALRGKRD